MLGSWTLPQFLIQVTALCCGPRERLNLAVAFAAVCREMETVPLCTHTEPQAGWGVRTRHRRTWDLEGEVSLESCEALKEDFLEGGDWSRTF